MGQQPDIPEQKLRASLQQAYNLIPATIEFLPLGLDSNAGVYRVVSEQGDPYLLKAKFELLNLPGYQISRYLRDQGITAVVAPILTNDGSLMAHLGSWSLILYPFLEGDSSFGGMSVEQWRKLGAIFKQIHQVTLPASGFESVRRETFDPSDYLQSLHDYETQHFHTAGRSPSQLALRAVWMEHQSKIHAMANAMQQLGARLRSQSGPFVICHADLHPVNLIRDSAGNVFVIDWDDVMLAPKERDFIFLHASQADPLAPQSSSPFFEGYGATTIDWHALTYYLFERVITDVIAFADDILFKVLDETTRTEAGQILHEMLTGGRDTAAAAFATEARLSSQ